MEERSVRISTGIPGLDRSLDDLRAGDIVAWQIESIGDYVFVATRFVTDEALTGRRIVYLRFGDHEELIPVEALDAAIAGGVTERWELAEYFGVDEAFLKKALCWYVHGNLAAELYF